jgi:hypothetical protein
MLEGKADNFSPDQEPNRPVLEYLKKRGAELANEYRTEDGAHVEHCGFVANDVAQLLIAEGKKPRIVSFRGKPLAKINGFETLKPLKYGGRVSWGGHIACLCENLVYDPLAGEPIPLESYGQTVFGAQIDISHETFSQP